MTPYKQLIRHDPENGSYGDCWRTAIACILNRRPENVPHFMHDGCEDNAEVNRRVARWLHGQGFSVVTIPFEGDLPAILNMMKVVNPGVWWILAGTSRTGCNHSVIGRDDAIVHDPSPVDAGIVGPCDDGYYWLDFIGTGFLFDEACRLPKRALAS